jgi:phosphate transport system protein
VRQDIALLMIAKNLERIGDHATNIAENVLYVETGEIHRHRPEARRGAE